MNEQKEWSNEQKEKTRKTLSHLDFNSFILDFSRTNKGCIMNHLNGAYGYIKLKEALVNKYNIYDMDTDKLLADNDSISDVINGGWKVSN